MRAMWLLRCVCRKDCAQWREAETEAEAEGEKVREEAESRTDGDNFPPHVFFFFFFFISREFFLLPFSPLRFEGAHKLRRHFIWRFILEKFPKF